MMSLTDLQHRNHTGRRGHRIGRATVCDPFAGSVARIIDSIGRRALGRAAVDPPGPTAITAEGVGAQTVESSVGLAHRPRPARC